MIALQIKRKRTTEIKVDNAPHKDNEVTKIKNTIKDFTQKIETLQSLILQMFL